MKYKYLPVLALFLLVSSALAQHADLNFNQMRYGQDYPAFSARILGLGGAGLSGGGSEAAFCLNPALAADMQGMVELRAGWIMRQSEEDREFPYYDSFVGFVDYGSYSYNAHRYNNMYGSLLWRAPEFWGQRLYLGAGYLPFKDHNYDYVEEVRDPVDKSDKLLGYNRFRQQGTLYSAPILIAARPINGLSLGWQIDFLTGSLDSTAASIPKLYADESLPKTERAKNKLEKKKLKNLKLRDLTIQHTFGAQYQFTEYLGLAATLRLPYSIKWDRTYTITQYDTTIHSTGSRKFEYPMRIAAGIDYRFVNPLQARLLLDVSYDFWSRFKDSARPDLSLNDTYTIRTGIEHVFFDQVPLRVGFAFGLIPENKELTRTLLTLGTGYTTNIWEINVSGGVSSMEFFQDDLYAESIFGLDDRTESDRVKLTEYYVRMDLKVSVGSIF